MNESKYGNKIDEKNEEYKLNDLVRALNTKKKFNKLPFDEFCELLEQQYDAKVPKEMYDTWKFTGLMNHDFLEIFLNEALEQCKQ